MIEFEMKGFENIKRKLEELKRKAEEIEGKNRIPFTELFPPGFMKRYSDFENIEELFDKSGFKVESEEDFEKIPDEEWDEFITGHTHFSNRQEMLNTATNEWIKRKLRF